MHFFPTVELFREAVSRTHKSEMVADAIGPQIVGLTASLGAGKGGDQSATEQHIINMTANLFAQSISRVVVHDEDLRLHMSVPYDGIYSHTYLIVNLLAPFDRVGK